MVVLSSEIETWKNKYLDKGLSESLLDAMIAEAELEWASEIYISDNPARVTLLLNVGFYETDKLPENVYWGFIHIYKYDGENSNLVKSVQFESLGENPQFMFTNMENIIGDNTYWGELFLFGSQDDETFLLIDEFGWNLEESLEITCEPEEEYFYPNMIGTAQESDVTLGQTFYNTNPFAILTGTYEIPLSDIELIRAIPKTFSALEEILVDSYAFTLYTQLLETIELDASVNFDFSQTITASIACIGSIA